MRKRSEREIQRESRWQEIMREQRESGQSVRAFCQQAGIEESAFYWWRRELARRSTRLRVQQRNNSLPPSSPEPWPILFISMATVRVCAQDFDSCQLAVLLGIVSFSAWPTRSTTARPLAMTIQRHEATFGVLEIDVQKRVTART